MREREKGEWREEGHLGGWEGGSYSPVLTEYQIHKDFSPNRTWAFLKDLARVSEESRDMITKIGYREHIAQCSSGHVDTMYRSGWKVIKKNNGKHNFSSFGTGYYINSTNKFARLDLILIPEDYHRWCLSFLMWYNVPLFAATTKPKERIARPNITQIRLDWIVRKKKGLKTCNLSSTAMEGWWEKHGTIISPESWTLKVLHKRAALCAAVDVNSGTFSSCFQTGSNMNRHQHCLVLLLFFFYYYFFLSQSPTAE